MREHVLFPYYGCFTLYNESNSLCPLGDGRNEVPTDKTTNARATGGVQAINRALDLLELMAAAGGESSLTDLASAAGLPLPTIHRLVRTLASRGYVRQEPSRRYALGPRLIGLGDSASRLISVWARPHLTELVDAIGETANLALMDGDYVMYAAQVPSRHVVRMFIEVGRRVPMHSTGVGKTLLAQLPEASARDILERSGMPKQTPHTITNPDDLLRELEEIRHRGYALDEGEQEVGVRCVAVPVPGIQTLAALSISGPGGRLTAKVVDRAVPLMTAAARRLARDLTGQKLADTEKTEE